MTLMTTAIEAAERLDLPDPLTRLGIRFLVERTRRRLAAAPAGAEDAFARTMGEHPIAEHPDEANRQHYEVPADFFRLCLGPHLKYSCCLFEDGVTDLGDAERAALASTLAHADLADGQDILELGCGWGSLSLYMAERLPAARITAVSNSHGQATHIRGECARRGLNNLTVVTADMNDFVPSGRFDRVVSVEMFEHMANWRALLGRIRGWLRPDGRLFVHVFTHRSQPYRFDHRDEADWIAQHFFTGGVMPSHGLIHRFGDAFTVEEEWRWSGEHYRRTADAWLAAFDARQDEIAPILEATYGAEAEVWRRRWRLFFLATSGLFGHAGGAEWGVSHYRLHPAAALSPADGEA